MLATTLFGVVYTHAWKAYRYHLHHKYSKLFMTVVIFILSDEILSNKYSNLKEEDVNTTVPFLIWPLMGNHGSFETNNSPDPQNFPEILR